ncbi:alcohol dehydrogenase catalytic domain-containing protein [Paenibacillus athensensis]|uniref:Alcohol dehydrogenase n=1 Tax=Paenibacillus athensensis TaxID=1967502 RepID=A0A4Y8Q0E3_9BACL|nr:alcohol dehydrogenase catalytic domain-containing protein [Paenibacillus athensensis]MCD1259370.1 alcohol dehydrogenase catalytic domain-containing protein [Paenibacillus athensensis]
MTTALIMTGTGTVVASEIESRGENVLEILQTGICGTDRHLYQGKLGESEPFVLGHEVVGIIRKLDNPKTLLGDRVEVGDRVILAPGINCGLCNNCILKKAFCENRFVYGFTPFSDSKHPELNGGFAQFLDLKPGSKVFKVKEAIEDDRAIFTEIIACAVGAVEKITEVKQLSQIGKCLILGAGAAGYSNFVTAEHYGLHASLADINPEALRLAEKTGVSREKLINLAETQDLSEQFDAVIDCTGHGEAFAKAIQAAAKGGVVIEFGAFAPTQPVKAFDFWEICRKELTVRGLSETLDRNFPMALRIVEATPYRLEQLLTKSFSLADSQAIEQFLASAEAGKGKIVPLSTT